MISCKIISTLNNIYLMLSIFLLNLFMKEDRFFFYLHCLMKCEYCALHGTLPYHTFTSDHNLPQKSAIFTPPCFFLLFRDCLARVIFPPSIDNTMQPYSKVEFHDASVIVIAEVLKTAMLAWVFILRVA